MSATRIVLRYIGDFSPAVVAIEKPLRLKTKRAALMSVIVQELNARSKKLGLEVLEI